MSPIDSRKFTDLYKLLAGAQLPALPQSAIKIMELAGDPQNGPAEFAVPIEGDPGLTGQVLRFVNSSYFGFSNEISNVKLAITLIGIRTIKNFALWSAVFSLLPNPRCGPFDLKSLWQDSLRRGIFARVVAKVLGRTEAEEVFAAALLQDMAVPVLAKELPVEYVELLKQRGGGQRRLSELEQERFGWTHAEAAGIMARQWRLPEEFAVLVENHIKGCPKPGEEPLHPFQMAVNLSALLPSSADRGWAECGEFEQTFQQCGLGNGPSLMDLLIQTDAEYEEFAPVLKLHKPARSLFDYYQQAVAASL